MDTHTLRVRDDAAPGEYRLLVGFYDLSDGTRLPVTDADNMAVPEGHVVLTNLSVVP